MKKKLYVMTATSIAAVATYSHHADAATYNVKAHDTLWDIATKNNISVSTLKQMNNLTSDIIYPNQRLTISRNNQATAVRQTATTANTTAYVRNTQVTGSYTVQPGDSLSLIAMKYNTSYQNIMQLNGLTSFLIYPGQNLKVSGTATQQTRPRPVAQSTQRSTMNGNTYVVKPGDYLYKIAVNNGVTVEQIKRWNNLSSNVIYANQRLTVSGNNQRVQQTQVAQPQPPQNQSKVTPVTYTSYTSPKFSHKNYYDFGQCTWHSFNRRQALGKGISTFWGNANTWASRAKADGFRVDRTPEVGAIAAHNSVGPIGHVAIVERINPDGSILVSEMNYNTPPSVVGYRTISAYEVPTYSFIH